MSLSAPALRAPGAARSGLRSALAIALALHVASAGWLALSKGIDRSFHDERFMLENVRRIYLQEHPVPTTYYWYAPLSYLPQTLLLLGVDRLERSTGWKRLAMFETSGALTDAGIRMARLCGVLFGCLALGALHLLCRRLWDAESADFAVLVLAASPWFARGQAGFKPDALLCLLTVAAFLPLLQFVREERALWLRLAALLAGAAIATKLNGALLALPVGLAALTAPTWARRLRFAAEAAIVTTGTALLLNPWPGAALHYLRRVDRQYDLRSDDLNFFEMFWTLLARLLRPGFLGPLFAVAAIAGLAVALRRLRSSSPRPVAAWSVGLWLGFPLLYLTFLSASTRYPKENHLLLVLPMAASCAGVGLAALAAAISRRSAAASRLVLPGVALAGALILSRYVAGESIGSPAERQLGAIRAELGSGYGRVVGWRSGVSADRDEGAEPRWGRRPPARIALDEALASDAERLARLDCVAGTGTLPPELERQLATRFPLRSVRHESRYLDFAPAEESRFYGCRAWSPAGSAVPLDFEDRGAGWFEARLPATLPPHDAVTAGGRCRAPLRPVEIEIAGRRLPLLALSNLDRGWFPVGTERARLAANGESVRIFAADGAPPELELLLWAAPAGELQSTKP